MTDQEREAPGLQGLSTKLEEEFVAPLTATKGALEILRDFPDLTDEERARFVETALAGCARLEQGVEALAASVYAAGRRVESHQAAKPPPNFASRAHINLDPGSGIAEVDLTGVTFESSAMVNQFYDDIDAVIGASERKWFFLIAQTGLSIWPEAWVAFAHREKRLRLNASLGTARFDGNSGKTGHTDPSLFPSRELALKVIEKARSAADE